MLQIVSSIAKAIALAAVMWVIGVSIAIIVIPGKARVSMHSISADGTVTAQNKYVSKNIVQRKGWVGIVDFILWPLSLPVMIAITAARAAWLRKPVLLWSMAGTMSLFCFLAGLSIGKAYVPSALALLVAALLNSICILFVKMGKQAS